ncbi:MAG: hypothetical protein ACI304_02925 [Lepagella sp.]
MSKSKFWTRAQVERLRALYHLHTNREIGELMGITTAAVSLMAFKLRLKKVQGKGVKVPITTEQIEWLRANYANTTNAEIMEHLGIKNSTLHRLARAYRLTKSKEFMDRWQKEITRRARATNERNNWPPKGYIIPKSREYCFKKGVTPLMLLGPERNAERIRKSSETRKATIASERRRILFGLEQRTKLKLNGSFRPKANVRYQMRKLGYLVDRGGNTATITPLTRRSEHYERRCKEVGIRIIYFDENYEN